MQVAQKKFLAKMWEERDPDIVVQTPEEAVILASIVEKETSRADERPLIASVFENRLRKKMRLQSDPTIIYGLVGGKGVLDHPIPQEELDRETAYNTYKINGLPPTPIANPGRAAIEAVLKPAKTKDLYFVADGTGGHAFAPSLDAHNDNVARWRQIERAKREQERAEAAAAAAAAAQGPPDGAVPKMALPALPRRARSSRRTRSSMASLRLGSRRRQAGRAGRRRQSLLRRVGQAATFRCPSGIRCVDAGLRLLIPVNFDRQPLGCGRRFPLALSRPTRHISTGRRRLRSHEICKALAHDPEKHDRIWPQLRRPWRDELALGGAERQWPWA